MALWLGALLFNSVVLVAPLLLWVIAVFVDYLFIAFGLVICLFGCGWRLGGVVLFLVAGLVLDFGLSV